MIRRMNRDTLSCLAFGFFGTLALMLPSFAYYYDLDIPGTGFPLGWLAQGAQYLTTFFHEIGHTVFFWFYGYAAVPHFDFQHGGGMSRSLTGQMMVIIAAVYASFAFLFYVARHERHHQVLLALLLVFHVATAFDEDRRESVVMFMGQGTELAVGGFMLWRALLNRARSKFERWLNALFGFFFIFSNARSSLGLMTSDVERIAYAAQKDGVNKGDFSRIAIDHLGVDIQHVAGFALACAVIALAVPVFLYWLDQRYEKIDESLLS